MGKKYPACGFSKTKKKGFKSGVQRYLCRSCPRCFVSSRRPSRLRRSLWKSFIWKRNTAKLIAARHGRSVHWVRKEVRAVVSDGKPGIRGVFQGLPIQMCHFHQKAIITKHLTRRPKLQAGKELRELIKHLCNVEEQWFAQALSEWHVKWQDFLRERTADLETGHWHYMHKRLRSAYRSLKTNLPYLFTYKLHPELNSPNTTNSLDGMFAHLKELL